jgi:DNA-binding NtrC family response regulator
VNFPCEDCLDQALCVRPIQRIILVDDDLDGLEEMSELLGHAGYDIRSYSTPADALSFLDENVCHVLLSDVQMPGMTGPQLAKRVAEQRPETQIILISGAPFDASSLSEGWSFFSKPFDFDGIHQAIRAFEANRVNGIG